MELGSTMAPLLFVVLLSLMLSTSSASSGVLTPGGNVEEVDQSLVMESGGDVDLSRIKFQAGNSSESAEASDAPHETSYVDIVIFALPPTCTTPQYCDYPSVGVGASPPVRFNSAATTMWCSNDRLYIEDTLFEGYHVSIEVPPTGTMEQELPSPTTFQLEQPGNYMVLMANCNPNGREIHFDGCVMFSSQAVAEGEQRERHGTLLGLVAVGCIFFFVRRWKQRTGAAVAFDGDRGSYANLEFQMV